MKTGTLKTIAKSNVIITGVALVVLVGLFAILQSRNSDAPAPVREYNLTVQNGKLTDDIDALTAYEDQTLIFNVTGDSTDKFHIHGYDKTLELKAGEDARLEFVADKTGRFEVEVHDAGQQLTVLEVNPKP